MNQAQENIDHIEQNNTNTNKYEMNFSNSHSNPNQNIYKVDNNSKYYHNPKLQFENQYDHQFYEDFYIKPSIKERNKSNLAGHHCLRINNKTLTPIDNTFTYINSNTNRNNTYCQNMSKSPVLPSISPELENNTNYSNHIYHNIYRKKSKYQDEHNDEQEENDNDNDYSIKIDSNSNSYRRNYQTSPLYNQIIKNLEVKDVEFNEKVKEILRMKHLISDQEMRISDLMDKLSLSEENNVILVNNINEYTLINNELNMKISELADKISNLEMEKKEWTMKKNELEIEKSKLELRIRFGEEREYHQNENNLQMKTIHTEYEKLKENLIKTYKEKEIGLNFRIKTLENEVNLRIEKERKAEEELNEMRKNQEETKKLYENKLTDDFHKYEKEINQLKTSNQNDKSDLSRELKLVIGENTNLKETNTKLAIENNEYKSKLQGLTEENTNLNKEKETIQKSILLEKKKEDEKEKDKQKCGCRCKNDVIIYDSVERHKEYVFHIELLENKIIQLDFENKDLVKYKISYENLQEELKYIKNKYENQILMYKKDINHKNEEISLLKISLK